MKSETLLDQNNSYSGPRVIRPEHFDRFEFLRDEVVRLTAAYIIEKALKTKNFLYGTLTSHDFLCFSLESKAIDPLEEERLRKTMTRLTFEEKLNRALRNSGSSKLPFAYFTSGNLTIVYAACIDGNDPDSVFRKLKRQPFFKNVQQHDAKFVEFGSIVGETAKEKIAATFYQSKFYKRARIIQADILSLPVLKRKKDDFGPKL